LTKLGYKIIVPISYFVFNRAIIRNTPTNTPHLLRFTYQKKTLMKFTMNVLLVLIMCLGIVGSSSAQKKKPANFKEGIIKYEIEVEGAPQVSQFVNNSIISLYLKEKNSKMDISIMGGMATFQLINNIKDDLFTLLMDVPTFYEKTAIAIDENSDVFKDLNVAKNKNKAPEKEKEWEVKYFKSKKKRIAKHSCYKAEVSMSGSDEKLTMYLTDKIRPEALTQIEKTIGKQEGFPLGFEIEVDGVSIKVMAVEIDKKAVSTEAFNVPDTYTKKSLEEFKDEIQNKLGGSGNGGGIGL